MQSDAASEALVDLLLDMKHELGKYLVMPVAMLPRDADDATVRDAARRALTETRVHLGEPRRADALWADFLDEGGPALRALSGFAALCAAVDAALSWEARLDAAAVSAPDGAQAPPLDRDALLHDLRAVGEHIAKLLYAAQSDPSDPGAPA